MTSSRLAMCLITVLLASTSWAQEAGGGAAGRGAAKAYLPLAVGQKWILRNRAQATPVVFEVVAEEAGGFRVRSTTPWGMSEWTLVDQDGKYAMVSYGVGGPMQPLPDKPLYLDFTRPAGSKWSGKLGSFSVVSRTATVQSASHTYNDCLQIRQGSGGNLLFTFAQGVGYVQFGEGKSAFVLDESASRLPGSSPQENERASAAAADSRPLSALPIARGSEGQRLVKADRMPLGITPNRFANEPLTVEVMTARFVQTLDAGAGFLVVNGKWAELEPRSGQYDLESIKQALSVATAANIPISYTLRVVDTIARDVPADLRGKRWSDPALQARLLRLIDAIAPLLRGNARWFMFGYEIDGYFQKHANEVQDFVDLHRLVASSVKRLVPGITVSSTLTFSGIDQLNGPLARMREQLDFLALTYTPLQPDFTVKNPSVVPADFARMKAIAGGKKIFFQEIAYPTSPAARGSEDKQAEFYRLALKELNGDAAAFAAVNFMNLADLGDKEVAQFASFYGLKGHEAFKGVLQTLGLFDKDGRPKQSWGVLLAR